MGERGRFAVEHRVQRAEALLALALHQVGRQREGRAAETDDRSAAVELAPQQAHRLGHKRGHCRRRAAIERVDLRARAHGLDQLRAGIEGHPAAKGLERQQDVREDDRRVEGGSGAAAAATLPRPALASCTG